MATGEFKVKRSYPESIAVVLPRYGKSLGGGAETLVKSLVDSIIESEEESAPLIEVWTTCALDHRTWENELEPGEDFVDGVLVRRFPVDERDLDVFISAEIKMREGFPLTADEQLDWLANSVNSKALYQHIAEFGGSFGAILFAPYLFATSFWGALIHPEKSVIIPCLHNEHYAYQGVFSHIFSSVRGTIFNAEPEMKLAKELYALPDLEQRGEVVGMGFDSSEISSANCPVDNPFILYSGRKETGKNLDLLIQAFSCFRDMNSDSELELIVIGSGSIDFLDELPEGVKDLGFVSEEDKHALMRDALALCQPSVNESFSIVLMEAWLHETPVIVHADCDVTKHHVVSSGGGLYFSTAEELIGVINKLNSSYRMSRELGLAGKRYVEEVYAWPAVLDRLSAAFVKFGLAKPGAPTESEEEAPQPVA